MDDPTRCKTICAGNGKQCTRRASKGNCCTQHAKSLSANDYVTQVEPWTARALPVPPEGTRAMVVQKLRRRLKEPSFARDEKAGVIYAYRLEGDPENFFKVGRTERSTAAKRMSEWARQHGRELECVREWPLPHGCKWTERVIHLYLDKCRLIRYEDGEKLVDFWFSDDTPLVEGSRKQAAMHRHVEWFRVKLDVLDAYVEPLVELVRKMKN